MLTPEAWAACVPHAGAMALIDAVASWDAATIHAIGERHRLADHPLRATQGLHAVHLAEYAAQASAVHAVLSAGANGETAKREGRLVSVRDMRLIVEYVQLSNGHLDIHAEQLLADERGAQYAFNVKQGGQLLVSGRVTVMYVNA
ncbi:phosphotransferase [Dyella monticola]|uniref:Phosphotransferase n=1 Tax=Dyella monticola TaxID=1927958 RepID=A0A370X231_9GAMM|nr:phosphotransferase [Dyella monticola]RDS82337.1 phosphotransferase [Dyella monticola]